MFSSKLVSAAELSAFLDGETEIGAGNRFLASCSIGASPQITGRAGDVGRLQVGAGNVFREFVTVHSGGEATTRIGGGGLFMATAHVAHDCVIGDEVVMANGATLGGHVEIGDRAQLSGLCAVHQHVRIGELAFVAGGAIVPQDVAPYCLVQGDRARLVSEAADTLYHLLVMLAARDLTLADVEAELDRREGVSGIAEKAARK